MDAEITIIGGGVVGLAIAEALSRERKGIFLLEQHKTFGMETSSRNSEVVHAGIYYPHHSLKARFCMEGRKMLYDFCDTHDLPYRKCGKLIVATTPEEEQGLRKIQKQAVGNGVELKLLRQDEVREMEPEVKALAALHSPETGIVESHSFMKQLETLAVNRGVQFAYSNKVTGLRKIEGGYEIQVEEADSDFTFTSEIVINAGGLQSDQLARMAGIRDESLRLHFVKGLYFRIAPPKNRLVKRLVYPVPYAGLKGLGIHLTLDMGGGAKLGPDAEYMKANIPDYSVPAARALDFYKAASTFLPFLEPGDLSPDMAGIRPKLSREGEVVRDFYIAEESERGYPGLINLIGIESPGLTASLAIGRYMVHLIKERKQADSYA